MFTREHKENLYAAIETVIEKPDGDEKHGLELQTNAVIQRAIKSMGRYYNHTTPDLKAQELGRFQQADSFRTPDNFARYKPVNNPLDNARCSENSAVKNFCTDYMDSIFDSFIINSLECEARTARGCR